MNRYVIAHLSYFDNNINMIATYANSGVEAMATYLELPYYLGKPLSEISEEDVRDYESRTDQVIEFLEIF